MIWQVLKVLELLSSEKSSEKPNEKPRETLMVHFLVQQQLVTLKQLVALRQQWQLFNLALMFFTRLPVIKKLPYSEKRMNQANRYFSLVGILLGCLVSAIFFLFNLTFSIQISVLLAMIASALLTGAFHEDGLADMADGIGGGLTKNKRLAIMKDSRLGTYGTITLVFTLLLKFVLLTELAEVGLVILCLIFSYGLSRAVAASLIFNTDYVTDDSNTKSKPIAAQHTQSELVFLSGVALLPFLSFFIYLPSVFSLLIKLLVCLLFFRFVFRRWLIARIGGFTGDCLGAAQQISELLIYLIVLSHFTVGKGL